MSDFCVWGHFNQQRLFHLKGSKWLRKIVGVDFTFVGIEKTSFRGELSPENNSSDFNYSLPVISE